MRFKCEEDFAECLSAARFSDGSHILNFFILAFIYFLGVKTKRI